MSTTLVRLLCGVWSVLLVGQVQSQDIIFMEDFAEGVPVDWESEDLGGTTARWQYCPVHNPYISSCPAIWSDAPNSQTKFDSYSSDNGFMQFDSHAFDYAHPGKDHNVYLKTKALNFSKHDQVWLKFDYQIGVFIYGTKDRALVEVSTDNVNWSIFNFSNILTGNTPEEGLITWSKNPSIAVIDISAVAANQENVYVRWRWESRFEYFFAIDDIHFYNDDPAPLFFSPQDLEMASFFAVYPNYSTPKSQIESFSFLGDFYNRGWQTVKNVNFKGVLNDKDGNQIFSDSVQIDSIERFSLIENIPFDNSFGDFTLKGKYFGEYSVDGALKEPTPFDNVKSFEFIITDSLFAKAEKIDGHLAPADGAFDGPHNWEFGNYYHMPRGDGQFTRGLSFSVAPSPPKSMINYMGIVLTVRLQSWSDENSDGLAQSTELGLLGVTPYTMTGFENEDIPIYVEFPQDIAMADNTSYLATVQFTPANGISDIRMGVGRYVKYGGMIAQTQLSGNPRYASVLLIHGPDEPVYSTNAFGFDLISTVNLHLSPVTAVRTLPEREKLLLYPNPNHGEFWVQRSSNTELPADYRVYDLLGHLIHQNKMPPCKLCKVVLPELPNGHYLLETSNAKEQTINRIQLLTKGH